MRRSRLHWSRIALHEAYARLRRSRLFVETDTRELMARTPSKGRNPEEQASDRELGALLQEVIDRLPPMYRTVFVMREIEGLGTIETAECLGLSAENVKVRLHRARARLRDEIAARTGTAAEAVFPFDALRCDRVVAAVFASIASRSP